MRNSMNVETENFELIFEVANQKVMNNLRVGTLARVVSVDKIKRTISVQPIVQEKINCNNDVGYKYIKLPVIKNVPYISGQYPKVNDYVVCLHLDRTKSGIDMLTDTTSFIESNTNRHNINDCIAIVINTKDEWELIGIYDSAISDIDILKYENIRVELIYSDIQLSSQEFDKLETSECIVSEATYNKSALFRSSENLLEILSISSDCLVRIYGK